MIDLLQRRRAMMVSDAQPTPPIPPEYTEVEYISIKGSKATKTDFVPTTGCKVEVGYKGVTQNTSMAGSLFGSRNGYNNKAFYYRITLSSYTAENMTHECGFGVVHSVTTPNIVASKNIYAIDNGTFYCNGDVIGNYTETFTPDYPIFIGSYNNAGSISPIPAGSGNYYYCKCWNDQGELVRDYKPVTRIADSVKGFYDVINQNFIPIE